MNEKNLNTDSKNKEQGVETTVESGEQQESLSKDQIVGNIESELEEINSSGNSVNDSESNLEELKESECDQEIGEIEDAIGSSLSDETKDQIHKNVVEDIVDNSKSENERKHYLEIMKKASEVLSEEDFLYFHNFLEKRGGNFDSLYDFSGKAMHTTNSYTFTEKILGSGIILTQEGQEGMYGSDGASFTDGDFSEAVTFQSVYDDQNTRSQDKKFNTENYLSKSEDFIRYFWETKQEETKEYLSKIGNTKVESLDEAIKIAEGFKFKAKPKAIEDNPEELAKLFGVTMVFNKDDLPELTKDGTEGLQRDFELRSYRDGGIPISDAKTVFTPENKIDEIKERLREYGMDDIEVRSSEEIEVARMINILERTE